MTQLNKYDFITYDQLIDISESDSTDESLKAAVTSLMRAVDDWPIPNMQEPKDLVAVLRQEMKIPLTFTNIKRHSITLNISDDAWKVEALTSLLEVFDFKKDDSIVPEIELEMILNEMRQAYRGKN